MMSLIGQTQVGSRLHTWAIVDDGGNGLNDDDTTVIFSLNLFSFFLPLNH